MSNLIPPLLSNTPPPIEDDDDDDFCDFRAAADLSYDNESSSLSPSPDGSPKKQFDLSIPNDSLDINSNNSEKDETEIDELKKINKTISPETSPEKSDDFFDFKNNTETVFSNNISNFKQSEIKTVNIMAVETNCLESEAKTVENCEIQDDFGGFSSASDEKSVENPNKLDLDSNYVFTTPQNGTNLKNQLVNGKSSPDEFGDFSSNFSLEKTHSDPNISDICPKSAENRLENNLITGNSSDSNKEIVSDFNIPENVCNENKIDTCEKLSTVNDNFIDADGFGDFSNFVKEITTEFLKPDNSDDFALPTKNNVQENPPEFTIEDQSDGFGDFAASSTKKVKETFTENTSSQNHNEESVFDIEKSILRSSNWKSGENLENEDFVEKPLENLAKNINNEEEKTENSFQENPPETISDDEFGDFATPTFTNIKRNTLDFENYSEDDGFGDFATPVEVNVTKQFGESPNESIRNNFGEVRESTDDFGDFESAGGEDFGNFADFSNIESEKALVLDSKQAFSQTEVILKEIFPAPSSVEDDYLNVNAVKDDVVFDQLKEVTETYALAYQWSKSKSQEVFLKALNIDTRNILYGPAWNSSMPRFAANLGHTPLEPMKSSVLTPTPILQTSINPTVSIGQNLPTPPMEIPNVDFDWNGSGLINPLEDGQSKEAVATKLPQTLEFAAPTSDFSILQPSPVAVSLEAVVPTKLLESFNELEEGENSKKIQLPSLPVEESRSTSWSNVVPLRETYISNSNSEIKITSNFDKSDFGWLQPTVLTVAKEQLTESPVDDFDDFQMVLPDQVEKNESVVTVLKPVEDFNSFDISGRGVLKPTNQTATIEAHFDKNGISVIGRSDSDEFTDFYSSVPPTVIQATPLPTLQPVLEPLKPSILHPQTQTVLKQNQSINWPDPGVTEEEIKRFEFTFPRQQQEKLVKLPKDGSVDDDEWSDFVSVQQSPIHKLSMTDRTASPDLPLSVLNLSKIQSPKKAIPVITAQGLMQTKLASNSNHSNTAYQQPAMFVPAPQSAQFKTVANADDDDWSDFVSSPVAVTANGWSSNQNVLHSMQETSDVLRNKRMNGGVKSSKVAVASKKSTIPSISSMPDLDFVAPSRGGFRTNIRK